MQGGSHPCSHPSYPPGRCRAAHQTLPTEPSVGIVHRFSDAFVNTPPPGLQPQEPELPLDLFQISNLVGIRGSMLPPATASEADLENVVLGDGAYLVVSQRGTAQGGVTAREGLRAGVPLNPNPKKP